jgi:O-antigen ligase
MRLRRNQDEVALSDRMSSVSYASPGPLAQLRRHSLPPSLLFLAAVMATIPLENCTVLPDIGSVTRLVGIVATGAVVLDAAIIVGFRRMHLAHLPLALFVVWSAWTCLWSRIPQLTSERIMTNIQLLILVWLIWQSVRELSDLRIVLQGFVLGACCAAILTLAKSGGYESTGDIRYSGAGADPNELGLTMVLSLPMAYYLSKTSATRRMSLLWLVPIPLCISCIVFTASRGASFTTLVALLCISIWHVISSSRMRFAPLILGVLLLALGLTFAPKANIERIATFQSEVSTGRVGKRTAIWKAGMQVFREHPFTGVGAATFEYEVEPIIGRTLAAHNVYVSVLTETGIIGFVIFSVAIIGCFVIGMHLRLPERALWLTVMLLWCIGVMSLTFEYKKATWAVFGLLIASAGISQTVRMRHSSQDGSANRPDRLLYT